MQAGEKVALVGPNGAGKSTLLLHLNGILRGDGAVRVMGQEVAEPHLARIRAQVGLVFQDPDDQLFSPTVFEDVAFGPLYAGLPEKEIRQHRLSLGVKEAWDAVPVSGVENAAYYYSTYNGPDKISSSDRKKVMVLGGGPNRIGQGIEFNYCCVHAAFALRDLGYETIMVNCNPETVSTDYDTSDKLYFEPLTWKTC